MLSETLLGPRLAPLLDGLVAWSSEVKQAFRMRVRFIVERMVRRFGYDAVEAAMPADHHKLLVHIKKMKERARRKKAGLEEEGGEEEDAKEENEEEDGEAKVRYVAVCVCVCVYVSAGLCVLVYMCACVCFCSCMSSPHSSCILSSHTLTRSFQLDHPHAPQDAQLDRNRYVIEAVRGHESLESLGVFERVSPLPVLASDSQERVCSDLVKSTAPPLPVLLANT